MPAKASAITALAFHQAGAEVTGFDLHFGQNDYPFTTCQLDVADSAAVRDCCQSLLVSQPRLDIR